VYIYLYIYISAIEIQTTGQILVKYGMGIPLNGGKVLSWVSTPYPDPWGGGGAVNGVWWAPAASTI
jgi:hypothetical protein